MLLNIALVNAAVDWTVPANKIPASGYKVTTENFPNSVDLGGTITAWAGTTNSGIDEVKFRWIPPEGSGIDPFIVIGDAAGSVNVEGTGLVYQWTASYIVGSTAANPVDEVGDWGVQAIFYDHQNSGSGVGPVPEQPMPVHIIARSFHVVPEVPFGILGAVLVLFGACGVYLRARSSERTMK